MRWIQPTSWKTLTLLVGTLLLLSTGSVVGYQSYREYETWTDHRYGILEDVFALANAGLPDVPDWRCVEPPNPMAAAPVRVQSFWVLGEASSASATDWTAEVSSRLPVLLDMPRPGALADLDQVWAYAQAHPDEVVVALTDRYHRGPVLNDRLEGFACGNVAVVNVLVDCPGSILAHEVGHVLGLGHTSSGLMQPRSVSCEDRLVSAQVLWLNAFYPAPPTTILVPAAGIRGEAGVGQGADPLAADT